MCIYRRNLFPDISVFFYPCSFHKSYCQKKKKVVQMKVLLLFTVCKHNKDVFQLKTESRASYNHGEKNSEVPSIFIEDVLFMQLFSGNPNNLLPIAFSLKKKWQPRVTSKQKEHYFPSVLILQEGHRHTVARNWHVLPKEMKCNENVFLVEVRECICRIT